jgi:hypothetical protein
VRRPLTRRSSNFLFDHDNTTSRHTQKRLCPGLYPEDLEPLLHLS